MNTAFLRGFDALLHDLEGGLSFCRPLISLESGSSTPVYYSSQLFWDSSDQEQSPFVTVNEDEISAFGTLLPVSEDKIYSGMGLIVMDAAFAELATKLDLLDSPDISFRRYEELQCVVGVCDLQAFREYEQSVVDHAKRIFDNELRSLSKGNLHEGGTAALYLLRKCGSSRDSDVAIRELAAALIGEETDLYRRLLIQYSIDLGETEHVLDERARRFIKTRRAPHSYRESVYVFQYSDIEDYCGVALVAAPLGVPWAEPNEHTSPPMYWNEFKPQVRIVVKSPTPAISLPLSTANIPEPSYDVKSRFPRVSGAGVSAKSDTEASSNYEVPFQPTTASRADQESLSDQASGQRAHSIVHAHEYRQGFA